MCRSVARCHQSTRCRWFLFCRDVSHYGVRLEARLSYNTPPPPPPPITQCQFFWHRSCFSNDRSAAEAPFTPRVVHPAPRFFPPLGQAAHFPLEGNLVKHGWRLQIAPRHTWIIFLKWLLREGNRDKMTIQSWLKARQLWCCCFFSEWFNDCFDTRHVLQKETKKKTIPAGK